MFRYFISSMMNFIQEVAPLSLILNIVIAVALMALGVYWLRKEDQPGQKFGNRGKGLVCVAFSGMELVGAAIGWAFAYVIF